MNLDNFHSKLLASLGISSPVRLGKGMEGHVYDFSSDKIIKIWLNTSADEQHLAERKQFYEQMDRNGLPFATPLIHEVSSFQGTFYTIERKLVGKRGDLFYLEADTTLRESLLTNYFAILAELAKVEITCKYGEVLSGPSGRTAGVSWSEFIRIKLEQTKARCLSETDHDIPDIEMVFEKYLREVLPNLDSTPPKHLVHGDLFLENVLVNPDGTISALLDFGPLTVIGDHLMDVAGLVYFASVSQGIESEVEDQLGILASKAYSQEMTIIRAYLIYYCLLFVNSQSYDPRTYAWCKRNLRRYNYLGSS